MKNPKSTINEKMNQPTGHIDSKQHSGFLPRTIKALLVPAMILAGLLTHPGNSFAARDEPIDTNLTEDCHPPIIDFSVRVVEGRAFLNWYVEGVSMESIYLILRSTDGLNFTNVGDRKGAASPYDVKVLNCFIDESPLEGTSYYKLVRINADLTTSTSRVVNINNNA